MRRLATRLQSHPALCRGFSNTAAAKPAPPSFARRAATAAAVATVGWGLYVYTAPPAQQRKPVDQDLKDPLVDVVTSLHDAAQAQGAGSSAAEELDGITPTPATRGQGAATAAQKASSSALPGPWVTDDDLAGALQRRGLAENKLRGYLHIKQREVQTWLDQAQMMGRVTREEFEKEMIAVEDEVNLQTNIIMYGVHDPHARRNYLAKYGCSKWSEQALKTVRSYSPLIEIGAGLGHWQRELTALGADVLAFDNWKALPVPDVRITQPEFVGKVVKGDEAEVPKHPHRTLLLVYPGPDDMAYAALGLYKGNTLLYAGESRGGVNGNDAFFDKLEKEWECVTTVPLEPFPEGYEKLWVLRRKQRQRRGWLW